MRLDSFRVTNFRSVEDSEEVTLGDMVCLVGKNEAGKTALLQALAGLNPHPATPTVFDRERDYPRRHLNEYDARHPKEEGEAIVITSKWSLSPEDVATLAEALGPDCLRSRQITLSRRYDDETFRIDVPLNYPAIAEYLMASHGLGETVREPLAEATTTDMLRKALEALAEPTPDQVALLETIRSFPGQNAVGFVGSYIRSVTPSSCTFRITTAWPGKSGSTTSYATGTHRTTIPDIRMETRIWTSARGFSSTSSNSPGPRWRRSRRRRPTSR